MPSQSVGLKSIALDFLAGLIALFFLLVWLMLSRTNDLQWFTLFTSVLFFLAGADSAAHTRRAAALRCVLVVDGGSRSRDAPPPRSASHGRSQRK
jgi:hypothetical protein